MIESLPTPEQAHCCHRRPGCCCGNNNPGMILVASTPNNNDNAVAVATVASAMSRDAMLLLSTWTAVQHTSSADSDPSSLPWPSKRISPLGGVFLVVVIRLHCCCCRSCCHIPSQSNLIILLVSLSLMRVVSCDHDAILVVPPPIWRHLL